MGRRNRESDGSDNENDDNSITNSQQNEQRRRDDTNEEKTRLSKHKRSSRKPSGGSSSRHRRRRDDRHDKRRRTDSKKRSKRSKSSSERKSSRSSKSRRDKRKRRKSKYESGSDSDDSSSDSSSSSDSDSSTSSSSGSEQRRKQSKQKRKVVNKRLLEKLAARGETLEEREERRSRQRSERIASQFGYTPEDNPFRDPNLHEPFSWKKKEEATQTHVTHKNSSSSSSKTSRKDIQSKTIAEIQKVRDRRKDREFQMLEMDRIRAEESRMREQENYDDWVRKEEEFHLRQQRQRSAIRLVEGREKPIDILAKNVLMFGTSENGGNDVGAATYREKYNALEEVEALEAELEEPHIFLRDLKLEELQELEGEVRAFCHLEREASSGIDQENSVLLFWEALLLVVTDEIKRIQTGGEKGSYATISKDICQLFQDKATIALDQMKVEIQKKLSVQHDPEGGGLMVDTDYWRSVLHHLSVFQSKLNLSEMHSKMLVRQLEKLEKRKDALAEEAATRSKMGDDSNANDPNSGNRANNKDGNEANEKEGTMVPKTLPSGDLEEELGLNSEVLLGLNYTWQEKYRPRKPRYFNRVKTGYDWNKYNQTHYDHDNPPPKIVQGYKFNLFYPDLIDRTNTPQYFLEACADSDEFCILRFHAGPPYEDVAFKIIYREWNKSRKRGFRCTFERGVLSLYFNFNSHWYRR